MDPAVRERRSPRHSQLRQAAPITMRYYNTFLSCVAIDQMSEIRSYI